MKKAQRPKTSKHSSKPESTAHSKSMKNRVEKVAKKELNRPREKPTSMKKRWESHTRNHEDFMTQMRGKTGHRMIGTKHEKEKANEEMMKGYGGMVEHELWKKREPRMYAGMKARNAMKAHVNSKKKK